MVDDDRLTVAMHALAAMRFYEPILPGDHVPFQAVAAAMSHAQGNGDHASMASYRPLVQDRMSRLHEMYRLAGVNRGLILAADQAIQIVMLAISDDCNLEKAESHRQAAHDACTGIGLSLV
jgi:hypothetical protein